MINFPKFAPKNIHKNVIHADQKFLTTHTEQNIIIWRFWIRKNQCITQFNKPPT